MRNSRLVAAAVAACSLTLLLASTSAGAATAPSSPRNVAATAGNASATVTWDAPSSNGGSAIVSYTVKSTAGGFTKTVNGQTRTATLTGLDNGTTYTFTVHATNDDGASSAPATSNAVTPTASSGAVPGAPTAVTASPGNGDALVSWSAPANAGSSSITSYVVTSSPGGRTATVGGSARSATVAGLTNGTAYTFTVRAVNAAGTGPASGASPAITVGAPDAPGNVQATTGDRRATITWAAPANNGSAITGYTIAASPGGASQSVDDDVRSATFTNLTNGTTYTFSVRAKNARGTGPASTVSATVKAATNTVRRLAGDDRIETAIELSQDSWSNNSATAVVLARSDAFADALAGAPLAARKGGPLLLTPPTSLDDDVEDEIDRLLADGETVYVLGGTAAISEAIEEELEDDYDVVRYAGDDRFETAAEIADDGLANPAKVFLVTGLDFPDALAAGAAAAKVGGAVLLTNGRSLGATTDDYLDDNDPTTVYTIGGQATDAYDDGRAIFGDDRYETAVEVAEEFFTDPVHVGIASGRVFADALPGSVHIARRGGPILLVSSSLPDDVGDYLDDERASVTTAHVYGGTSAVSRGVADDVRDAIT